MNETCFVDDNTQRNTHDLRQTVNLANSNIHGKSQYNLFFLFNLSRSLDYQKTNK